MSGAATARVQCAKCGAPASNPAPLCASCGGRMVKVCGSCQMQNSMAKNFCDACGSELLLVSAAVPGSSAAASRPASFLPRTLILGVRRAPPPPGAAPAAPSDRGARSTMILWGIVVLLLGGGLALYGPKACGSPPAEEAP